MVFLMNHKSNKRKTMLSKNLVYSVPEGSTLWPRNFNPLLKKEIKKNIFLLGTTYFIIMSLKITKFFIVTDNTWVENLNKISFLETIFHLKNILLQGKKDLSVASKNGCILYSNELHNLFLKFELNRLIIDEIEIKEKGVAL